MCEFARYHRVSGFRRALSDRTVSMEPRDGWKALAAQGFFDLAGSARSRDKTVSSPDPADRATWRPLLDIVRTYSKAMAGFPATFPWKGPAGLPQALAETASAPGRGASAIPGTARAASAAGLHRPRLRQPSRPLRGNRLPKQRGEPVARVAHPRLRKFYHRNPTDRIERSWRRLVNL